MTPLRSGLVASLAHPGGNITGLSALTPELNGKRLELLKEMLQTHRHREAGESHRTGQFKPRLFSSKEYEARRSALKMQLQSLEVRGSNPDLERAHFKLLSKSALSA